MKPCRTCHHCQAPFVDLKKCARCRVTYYCSESCQTTVEEVEEAMLEDIIDKGMDLRSLMGRRFSRDKAGGRSGKYKAMSQPEKRAFQKKWAAMTLSTITKEKSREQRGEKQLIEHGGVGVAAMSKRGGKRGDSGNSGSPAAKAAKLEPASGEPDAAPQESPNEILLAKTNKTNTRYCTALTVSQNLLQTISNDPNWGWLNNDANTKELRDALAAAQTAMMESSLFMDFHNHDWSDLKKKYGSGLAKASAVYSETLDPLAIALLKQTSRLVALQATHLKY